MKYGSAAARVVQLCPESVRSVTGESATAVFCESNAFMKRLFDYGFIRITRIEPTAVEMEDCGIGRRSVGLTPPAGDASDETSAERFRSRNQR
jgi:hypothetical protein